METNSQAMKNTLDVIGNYDFNVGATPDKTQ